MTRKPLVAVAVLLAALAASFAAGAAGGEFEPRGVTFTVQAEVPVPPADAFDAFTGDVTGWWDHSFSETPARMFIEPRPGGGFYEYFDDAGNGVLHATVTYAQRGEKLVFKGPLGLHGRAFEMVHTVAFEPAERGTLVTVSVHGLGELAANEVEAIEGVWKHFLVERFQPWVERGDHEAKLGQ